MTHQGVDQKAAQRDLKLKQQLTILKFTERMCYNDVIGHENITVVSWHRRSRCSCWHWLWKIFTGILVGASTHYSKRPLHVLWAIEEFSHPPQLQSLRLAFFQKVPNYTIDIPALSKSIYQMKSPHPISTLSFLKGVTFYWFINSTQTSGIFPNCFKNAIIELLLKLIWILFYY